MLVTPEVHARRCRIAGAYIGLIFLLGVFATYQTGGLWAAVAIGASFTVIGVFFVRASRKAIAWRVSHPGSESQHVPLEAMGGVKEIALFTLGGSLLGIGILVLASI